MTQTNVKIPEHPLFSKLGAAGTTNVLALKGYVGPASNEANLRLYASLDDLSESVEIARADVIHAAEAPESVLPYGGTVLWVRKETQVTVHRAEKLAATQKVDRDFLEVNRGRLRIMVRGGAMRAGVCQSRCGVCQSRCGVCQSRCGAVFNHLIEGAGPLARFR